MDVLKKIEKIKKDMEEIETKKTFLKGQLQVLEDDLKNKHGLSSIEETEKFLKTLEMDIDNEEKLIIQMLIELEESYVWNQ